MILLVIVFFVIEAKFTLSPPSIIQKQGLESVLQSNCYLKIKEQLKKVKTDSLIRQVYRNKVVSFDEKVQFLEEMAQCEQEIREILEKSLKKKGAGYNCQVYYGSEESVEFVLKSVYLLKKRYICEEWIATLSRIYREKGSVMEGFLARDLVSKINKAYKRDKEIDLYKVSDEEVFRLLKAYVNSFVTQLSQGVRITLKNFKKQSTLQGCLNNSKPYVVSFFQMDQINDFPYVIEEYVGSELEEEVISGPYGIKFYSPDQVFCYFMIQALDLIIDVRKDGITVADLNLWNLGLRHFKKGEGQNNLDSRKPITRLVCFDLDKWRYDLEDKKLKETKSLPDLFIYMYHLYASIRKERLRTVNGVSILCMDMQLEERNMSKQDALLNYRLSMRKLQERLNRSNLKREEKVKYVDDLIENILKCYESKIDSSLSETGWLVQLHSLFKAEETAIREDLLLKNPFWVLKQRLPVEKYNRVNFLA